MDNLGRGYLKPVTLRTAMTRLSGGRSQNSMSTSANVMASGSLKSAASKLYHLYSVPAGYQSW